MYHQTLRRMEYLYMYHFHHKHLEVLHLLQEDRN